MRVVAILAVCAALGACATGVTLGAVAPTATSERISELNFTLGESRTAVVGEQVVRVKDYVQTTLSTAAVEASNSAQFTMGLGSGRVAAGGQYPIIGQREADGVRRRLVQLGDSVVQVNDDGTPHQKGLVRSAYGDWIEPLPNMVFTPPVTFLPVTRIDTRSAAAGENYEIVFTGRDAQSLRFQYREYTADDLARPAFSQDLTYPVSSPTIRFRGLTINVIEVGSDSITYAVASREVASVQ